MARRFVFAGALSLLLGGCGNSDGPSGGGRAEAVTVSPLEATLEAGTSTTLRANATDAEGNALASASVQWSTSNASVASVANTGVVTAVGSGVARITAAAADRSGSALVAVVPRSFTQTVGAGGSVSTPGGEVRVALPPGVPAGASVKIEPVTGTVAGATAPGTVYKIGVFNITTPAQPTITVRYYVEGLPPGFDERNLRLSRKIGVFWVSLPTVVDVTAKTLTATIPAGAFASAATGVAFAASAALDEETTVGAALFALQPDPASVQLAVGERRRISARLVALANGAATTVAAGSASSNAPGIANVAGAAAVNGAEVSVEVIGAAAGTAVVTFTGTLNFPTGGSEQFGAAIPVTVAPSGSLNVTIQGLPAGVNANVVVTGPSFSRALTSSQVITPLAAGTYTITAANVTSGGETFLPNPPTQTVTLANGEAKAAAVTYASALGSITVNIFGLPAGTNAAVTVTGPGNFSRSLTGSQLLTQLTPGAYTVTAATVTSGNQQFSPTPPSQTISVAAGQSATAEITYVASPGSLTVNISGLPAGVAAGVTVTGPNAFSRALTGTQTLAGLVPGSYTVTAAPVNAQGQTFNPSPGTQSAAVPPGQTATASVHYVQTTGSLTVTVTGLSAVNAAITVTGPGNFNASVLRTQTLTGLLPGSYAINASPVGSGQQTFNPSPRSQNVTVVAGQTAAATVAYALAVALPSAANSHLAACPAATLVKQSSQIQVLVQDDKDQPIANATVEIQVSGSENFFTSKLVTNDSGRASTLFTSSKPEAKKIVAQISKGGTLVTKGAEIIVAGATNGAVIRKVSGDNQQIKVGTVGLPFTIAVLTSTGLPAANVPIAWQFDNCFPLLTNSDGRSSAGFTTPFRFPGGPFKVTAQIAGGASVTFAYTVVK